MDSKSWEIAIDIFIKRIEPHYLEPVRLLISHEKELDPRERKFGFTIMAINCLLIETLHCFRKGIIDNRNNGPKTFRDFLTQSKSFKKHFDTNAADNFYLQICNGILHQAETKEDSRIRSVGPLIRKFGNGIVINRTEFSNALENEFHIYVEELSKPANTEIQKAFKTKMNHICGCSIG